MTTTKKYRIRLTKEEQKELKALVTRRRTAAYKQTHARILLMSDESRPDGGMTDADISRALGVGLSMVERVRRRCVEGGIDTALNRKKQLRRREKRLDGEGEARLIAMACGEPPEGRTRWTLKPESTERGSVGAGIGDEGFRTRPSARISCGWAACGLMMIHRQGCKGAH